MGGVRDQLSASVSLNISKATFEIDHPVNIIPEFTSYNNWWWDNHVVNYSGKYIRSLSEDVSDWKNFLSKISKITKLSSHIRVGIFNLRYLKYHGYEWLIKEMYDAGFLDQSYKSSIQNKNYIKHFDKLLEDA